MNGSGRAPAALTLEKCRELGIDGKEIPFLNINSATVPGCAAVWHDTIEQLGSGKVTLADVLAPAIRLAEEGWVFSRFEHCSLGVDPLFQRSI